MGCEDRRWIQLAQVRFLIAAFVMSGFRSSVVLFQQRNSVIPNLATNMPTDSVNNYFGRGFILEGCHKYDGILWAIVPNKPAFVR